MWVRSQDKTRLTAISCISIETENNGVAHMYENKNDLSVFLGKYKTEKRAVEVLDEIQNQLNNISRVNMSEADAASGWLKTEYSEVIYQMPEK